MYVLNKCRSVCIFEKEIILYITSYFIKNEIPTINVDNIKLCNIKQ